MNGAEAAELADVITVAKWCGVVESTVVREVLKAESDGRELKRRQLTKLLGTWSSSTIKLATTQLLTRQVLQSSGALLFLQRDYRVWKDKRGQKMSAEKGFFEALEEQKKLRDSPRYEPRETTEPKPEPAPEPKPDTPETVKGKSIMGKLVGNWMRDTMKGKQ